MPASIFISHSSKNEPDVAAFVQTLIKRLQRARLTTRIDHTDLAVGDGWRLEISRWMLDCHVAIIVLSPDALQSPWVLRETAILTWRREVQPDLVVLPVLHGVDVVELKRGPWAPLAVHEIEVVKSGDKALREIVKRLRALPAALAAETPLSALVELVTRELKPLHGMKTWLDRIDAVLAGVREARPFRDPLKRIAERLLGSHFTTLHRVIPLLAAVLDKQAVWRVIELVAPIILPIEGAGGIVTATRRAPGMRAIALNARKCNFTGPIYVRRAFWQGPLWHHPVVQNITGADPVEELVERARDCLSIQLDREHATAAEIDEALEQVQSEQPWPVLLLIPPPMPSAEALARLQQVFPRVTFFLFSGEQHPPPGSFDEQRLTLLLPELDPGAEARAERDVSSARLLATTARRSQRP
jgi:hypothetical protein